MAELLNEHPDVEVRGGSSDPSRVELAGVYPVPFSWSDAMTWPAAVHGIDSLFIVRPDRPDAPELIAELLAVTSPHTHVVLLSEFDGGYFAEDDWAPRTERVVRDGGRTWTVLRPGWFMQVFTDTRFMLGDLVEHGRLAFPSGGQPVSWIDTRDIAAVAARALLDTGHEGSTYELTGPKALTLPRTAELLSAAVSRPVEHVELSMEEALAGSEGFARRNDEGAFDRIRLGLAKGVTDTVERVTGHPPRSMQEFIADHQSLTQNPAKVTPSGDTDRR
ncbi:MAG: nucleoside-diphosphate sugar epimerase [Brachybacterium sp.]|uniref:nucleoside-diphosphate sugar epimerase n=1 Tax=Brachybacterium sp. TaxID=1891286 RepID=UPI002648D944|nr:nucleoside-diphosphate sugar epimerase [Brachybacterium sp.]MDN5686764.1 nucleoside-diphosphate sugar epimerase [Brachybacterium sp.]